MGGSTGFCNRQGSLPFLAVAILLWATPLDARFGSIVEKNQFEFTEAAVAS